MKLILEQDSQFVLRFDQGEEVLSGLISFCAENGVGGGFFSGIGAAREVELAFYDLEQKEYQIEHFDEDLEIVSLTGNVAIHESEILIHAHGSFADDEYEVTGGHIRKLVVSATCEIFLTALPVATKRAYSKDTGLNLLD